MNQITKGTHKWVDRFLALAEHVASWSKDPSTQCGAVIVRDHNKVVSLGFNGFPPGMDDNPKFYADREVKYSRIVHAEVNALILAERSVRGFTLFTWPFVCCDRCAAQMIAAGIKSFVFPALPEDKKERWQESMDKSKRYMNEVGASWWEVIERKT